MARTAPTATLRMPGPLASPFPAAFLDPTRFPPHTGSAHAAPKYANVWEQARDISSTLLGTLGLADAVTDNASVNVIPLAVRLLRGQGSSWAACECVSVQPWVGPAGCTREQQPGHLSPLQSPPPATRLRTAARWR